MSKDFSHLRHWITGEGYAPNCPSRPVILECIPSRSGMSMTVYDRGERLYAINGYGFDRLGCALAEFLCSQFTTELKELAAQGYESTHHVAGSAFQSVNMAEPWAEPDWRVTLEGACGFEAMRSIAEAIHLKVTRSESKAGTLIIIEKGN